MIGGPAYLTLILLVFGTSLLGKPKAIFAQTDTELPAQNPKQTLSYIPINDHIYELETFSDHLVCDNFTLESYSTYFTMGAFDPQIGERVRIRHYELPRYKRSSEPQMRKSYLPGEHYISTTFFTSPSTKKHVVTNIENHFENYSRIADDRVYNWSADKCLPDDKILISLYSGGNCTNVCEAWGILQFDGNAKIKTAEGLTLAAYNKIRGEK